LSVYHKISKNGDSTERDTRSCERRGGLPLGPTWTVDEAEAGIRAMYGLEFGGIKDQNGAMKGTDVIGNAVGDLTFVGGREISSQPTGIFAILGSLPSVFVVILVSLSVCPSVRLFLTL
jgi:hypothetical protein